jgi:hypothetical protein
VSLLVDQRVRRGGSAPVPDYLGWWLGLRRPPQQRTLWRPNGNPLTVVRRPGYTSISSLRAELDDLGLRLGCKLVLRVDRATDAVLVSAACVCHLRAGVLDRTPPDAAARSPAAR